MGQMVRMINRPFTGSPWRESRRDVVRARSWVAKVAKMRCQQVSRIAMLVSRDQDIRLD